MNDRVEVTAGPGIVVRYGGIAIWAGPEASPALLSFLTQSARNLSPSPRGGRQIADHIADVLRSRDPEPHVPFVTLGPSDHGWAALLHGPVQAWDGARWLAPTPNPGWLQAIVTPQPTITVSAAGAASARALADVPWDLEAGVVPGGGFVLLPAAMAGRGPTIASPVARFEPSSPVPVEAVGAAGHATGPSATAGAVGAGAGAGAGAGPGAGAGATDTTALPSMPPTTSLSVPVPDPSSAAQATSATQAGAATQAGTATQGRPATQAGNAGQQGPAQTSGQPASPPGGVAPQGSSSATGPIVGGVRCSRGHFNHPRAATCPECGVAITAADRTPVSGARPSLGALVLDDGTVASLDQGYVLGSAPERDPTVTGGLARPLRLEGDGISPAHAEIRLSDWDVVLVDRGSARGTFVYEPGATEWSGLPAYRSRVLRPGTHVAVAQRVLTFTSPWP